MRVARPLVGIGMSSKQLAPLSLQQALVTRRRRLIQHRRFWPATPHFLVLAAVALPLPSYADLGRTVSPNTKADRYDDRHHLSVGVRCVRGFIFAETAAGETKRDKLED